MNDILAVSISNVYDTYKMKYLLDSANINTHESYIKPLMNLFKKR